MSRGLGVAESRKSSGEIALRRALRGRSRHVHSSTIEELLSPSCRLKRGGLSSMRTFFGAGFR